MNITIVNVGDWVQFRKGQWLQVRGVERCDDTLIRYGYHTELTTAIGKSTFTEDGCYYPDGAEHLWDIVDVAIPAEWDEMVVEIRREGETLYETKLRMVNELLAF